MSDTNELVSHGESAVIGSRTLHRNTKEVLDRVQAGDSLLILRHGRPAAALVPVDEARARTIALAGSPLIRGLMAEPLTADIESTEPFAVAAREVEEEPVPRIGGETAPAEELSVLGEETSRLLAKAAKRLAAHRHETIASEVVSGKTSSVSASLLMSQQRSANAALQDLLGVIRVQAEALEALAEPQASAGQSTASTGTDAGQV